MTHQTFELVELGQAEALIEFGMPFSDEEVHDKYVPASTPYVEFE